MTTATWGPTSFFDGFDTLGNGPVALSSADYELYDGPGNAGYGVRTPDNINVVADAESTSGNGQVLELTATNDGGTHDHAGLKILRPATYFQFETRVAVDDDATVGADGPGGPGVTSGVVLFWPTENEELFPAADNPEGVWPAGGELDFWESFDDRDTRTPVRSFVHRLNPAATPPYVAADDEVVANVPHYSVEGDSGSGGIDQSSWHKIVCSWTPDGVFVSIDDGPDRVITTDPASIPSWDMEPTLQLDAWSNTPPDSTVRMRVDYVLIRPYLGPGSLPEEGLDGDSDHQADHAVIHDVANAIATDTTVQGDVLGVATVGVTNSVVAVQPTKVRSDEVVTITHDTAGDLAIPLEANMRAVVVQASAPISGWDITNHAALGESFFLPILIEATSGISVSLPTDYYSIIGPEPPGTMLAGERHPLILASFTSVPPPEF